MIPEIKKKFTNEIRDEVLGIYDLSIEKVKDLGGFESHVYEFTKNNKEYILKVTHNIRRTENYLMGEVDYVNYLADNGVSVARIVQLTGKFIEVIPENDNEYFLSYVIEKVYGDNPEKVKITANIIQNIGEVTGRMHALSMKYKLPDKAYTRERWHETDLFINYSEYLPAGSELLAERINEILTNIAQYPESEDTFGLIHGDIHSGNFFVRENDIAVFDFDDLENHYFISDPAVSLYYLLPKESREDFTDFFMTNYIKGYRLHNEFKKQWLEQMQDFLKLRDVLLAIVIYQAFDFGKIDEGKRARCNKRIENINNKIPVIDLDFTKYY